jgi:hypothetical protein
MDDRSYTYVEANGALLDVAVGRILGGVEARREVPAADEAAQAAGVHVWQLHDEALRLREPLLHHRRPTTRRDVACPSSTVTAPSLADEAGARGEVYKPRRRRSDRQVWVVSGYAFLDEVGKEKRREAAPSKQSIVFHLLKRAAVVRQYM